MGGRLGGSNMSDIIVETVGAEDGTDTTENLLNKTIGHLNGSRQYTFEPTKDVKLMTVKGEHFLQISIKANAVGMVLNNLKFIKVILTSGRHDNLDDIYRSENFIKEIHFNLDDYISTDEKKLITERMYYKKIKITSTDHHNDLISTIDKQEENINMLLSAIENECNAGKTLHYDSTFFDEVNELNLEKKKTEINNIFVNDVMMKKQIKLKTAPKLPNSLWIKIIEMNKNEASFNTIIDYNISSSERMINRKFSQTLVEKNNYLEAYGLRKKKRSLHHINVINEVYDKVEIYKKSSIDSRFKMLEINDVSLKKETLIKIPGSNDCIYRVIDKNNTFKDVFIGDVKREFLDDKPSATSITTNYGNVIIIKHAPADRISHTLFRSVGDSVEFTEVQSTDSFKSITMSNLNDLILYDPTPRHNKQYKYYVRFYTDSGNTIDTSETNYSKFIETTGKYSMSVVSRPTMTGSNIHFTTSVPSTEGTYLFDAIEGYFPDVDEGTMDDILKNYSYISFVKLMSINRKTGKVKVIDTKTAIHDVNSGNHVATFNITESDDDKNNLIYFGEMFASSIITLMDNIKASGKYESGATGDYIPVAGLSETDSSFDEYNFNSKFYSFDSINSGTLVYGKALANKPGKLIETGKTGVIEFLEFKEEEIGLKARLVVELDVIDRETPVIQVKRTSSEIDSAIIISSSSSGFRVVKEKSLLDDDRFVFYDVNAKENYSNETITYHVIPVYNNYKLGAFLKAGTVLCVKDDFRVL